MARRGAKGGAGEGLGYGHSLRIAASVVPSVAHSLQLAGTAAQIAVGAGAAIALVVRLSKPSAPFYTLIALWAGLASAGLVGSIALSDSPFASSWLSLVSVSLSLCLSFASSGSLLSLQLHDVLYATPLGEAFERILFALSPPSGILSLCLAASDLYGSAQLPLATVPIAAAHQHLFTHSRGIPSAVPGSSLAASEPSAFTTIRPLTALLPSATYVVVQSLSAHSLPLVSQLSMILLLLGSGSLASLPLDWLLRKSHSGSSSHKVGAIEAIAPLVVAAGLHGALIDPVLTPYMMPLLRVEAPTLARILLASPTFAIASLPALKAVGERISGHDSALELHKSSSAFVGVCTGAFASVLGSPLPMSLALMLAVQGGVLFFMRDEEPETSLAVRMAFLLSVFIGWFLSSHFWFLDATVGGVSLKVLCTVVLVSCMSSLLIPALISGQRKTNRYANTAGVLLCINALLITACELILRRDGEGELLSPITCVLTTVIGCVIAHRLAVCGRVRHNAAWLAGCLLCAKLSILEDASASMYLSSFALIAGATGRAVGLGPARASALLLPFGVLALKKLLGLTSSTLLGIILSMLPISVQLPRSAAAALAALGASLVALQPPLQFHLETLTPDEGLDSWLLVLIIGKTTWDLIDSRPERIWSCTALGVLFAGYLLPTSYFAPGSLICFVSVACASAFCSSILLNLTSADTMKRLSGILIAMSIFAILFSFEYFLVEESRILRPVFEIVFGVSDNLSSIEALVGLQAAVLAFSSLCTHLRVERYKGVQASPEAKGAASNGASSFDPFTHGTPFGESSGTMPKLSRDGLGWLPFTGNLFALTSYWMAIGLNHKLANGSAAGALLLSAVLLLRPRIERKLDECSYLIPYIAVMLHCVLMEVYEEVIPPTEQRLIYSQGKLWAQQRDLLGFLLALPALVLSFRALAGSYVTRHAAGISASLCMAPLIWCQSPHAFTFIACACIANVAHIALQSRRLAEAREML